MKKKTETGRDLQRWCPSGEVTIYTASDSKPELIAALGLGKGLEIDLSNVREMDTAGLQLLILAKLESKRSGQTLRITGHNPAVVELLDLFNMTGFFGDPVVMSSKDH